jgi:hypothetical protein
LLYDSPTWITLSVILIGCVVLTVLGLAVTVKWVDYEFRKTHNEFVGFLIAVVGLNYSVMLAFVAVGVWEDFKKAEEVTHQEASLVNAAYRNVIILPEPARSQSVAKVQEYLHTIIDLEWPAMGRGTPRTSFEATASQILNELQDIVASQSWSDPKLSAICSELLQQTSAIRNARSLRLHIAISGVHSVVWFVILVGATLTIAFSFLFGIPSVRMHMLMSGSVALSIALLVALIVMLDFPFRGEVQVDPSDFENVLFLMKALKS